MVMLLESHYGHFWQYLSMNHSLNHAFDSQNIASILKISESMENKESRKLENFKFRKTDQTCGP